MSPRTALAGAAALALALAPAAAAAPTVHLRGTAYEFNKVHTMLAGATIRVAEFPALKTTVRSNGTYDLAVPDHAKVTPYIVAPGYHTIYLQTFTTDGEDLRNVNFQTPSDGIYKGLVALLGVPVDEQGNPTACAIVSTFSTRNVRDLTFAGFIGYGAHGIAGATASASPALPAPTYFNENVIPDPAQQASSKDGGVVWTGVPAGVYTITAQHPTTRFASFVATCEPGRIVNANPPWGLHELAPPNPARVQATWKGTTLRAVRVTNLPPGSILALRCLGGTCNKKPLIITPTGSTARLTGNPVRLHPGQSFEVAITTHAYDGVTFRWPVRRGATPQAKRLCVPLGLSRPRAC